MHHACRQPVDANEACRPHDDELPRSASYALYSDHMQIRWELRWVYADVNLLAGCEAQRPGFLIVPADSMPDHIQHGQHGIAW